jgi:hypothetical protein
MDHEDVKIVVKATRKVTCVVSHKNIEGHTRLCSTVKFLNLLSVFPKELFYP